MENILHGNPLLATGGETADDGFKVKRRWDDDVVFKNCAKGLFCSTSNVDQTLVNSKCACFNSVIRYQSQVITIQFLSLRTINGCRSGRAQKGVHVH